MTTNLSPDDYGTVRLVDCGLTICFNCHGHGCHRTEIWDRIFGVSECCICRGVGLVDAKRFAGTEDALDRASRLGVDGGSLLDPDEELAPCSACDGEAEYCADWGNDWNNGPWEVMAPCPECRGTGRELVTARQLTIDDLDERSGEPS